MLYENERPVRREGYMTDLITDGAVAYLKERRPSIHLEASQVEALRAFAERER